MRISKEEYFLGIAELVALRSTCARRQVGCVLTNYYDHIVATGYNGVPKDFKHCSEDPAYRCAGADSPSGTNLNQCLAIHAEANALLQCKDHMAINTAWVTVTPCIECTKLLLNTSCRTIISRAAYPHSDAMSLWTASGRSLRIIPKEN